MTEVQEYAPPLSRWAWVLMNVGIGVQTILMGFVCSRSSAAGFMHWFFWGVGCVIGFCWAATIVFMFLIGRDKRYFFKRIMDIMENSPHHNPPQK